MSHLTVNQKKLEHTSLSEITTTGSLCRCYGSVQGSLSISVISNQHWSLVVI